MKKMMGFLFAFVLSFGPVAAFAEAPKCEVCSMRVDVAHNVHFKYTHETGGRIVQIGSLTCAKSHWKKNEAEKMKFEAKDFVTGKFHDASKGVFLVGSKLNVGTGMDKGSAVFFADRATAEMAKKANGGRIVALAEALSAVGR